ncbi:MAG: AAA family ATPase [Oscillospiraceae bacterium]|nr:AAA family ATPase [Oscillospiraceae bacterium]
MIDEKRKTTVPVPSVGADGEQPISNYSSEIITTCGDEINPQAEFSDEDFDNFQRMIARMCDPSYLHTVTLNELYETNYPSRPPIIDGLLYSGTYLLAGAPKVGKSFLVAQLAYHISAGLPLWDFPVKQCTVLYLALEDDYKRLQDRMFRMFGVESTEHLFFETAAKQIGAGLEDQLELFIREHPNTQLIIIDTLQKIRELSGESYSYASDYEIIGKLKMFADKHGICLLLVHHTRKQPASDKFEMISGTTGLLGCADGAFLLQKERGIAMNATLDVVGRDQPEQKIFLIGDREHLNWTLDHIEAESTVQPPDPILEKVNTFLKGTWTGTPTDLVQLLEMELKPNVLSRYLNVNKSRLENEYGIDYQNNRTHSGRIIVLNRTKLTP